MARPSKIKQAIELLRIILEERVPAPCLASQVADWWGEGADVSVLLSLIEAEILEDEIDPVVICYEPGASDEERCVALLMLHGPLTMKQIRFHFRDAFPGTAFREASLMLTMGMDPRIELLSDNRYAILSNDEDREEEWEDESAEDQETDSDSEESSHEEESDNDALSLFAIPLAVLKIKRRTLRFLARHGLHTIGSILNGPPLHELEDFRPLLEHNLYACLRALIPPNHPARQVLEARVAHIAWPTDENEHIEETKADEDTTGDSGETFCAPNLDSDSYGARGFDTRFERMIGIIRLLALRCHSCQQLADIFGVSCRTIERDLDLLYRTGFRLLYHGKGWGYSLDGGYKIPLRGKIPAL